MLTLASIQRIHRLEKVLYEARVRQALKLPLIGTVLSPAPAGSEMTMCKGCGKEVAVEPGLHLRRDDTTGEFLPCPGHPGGADADNSQS